MLKKLALVSSVLCTFNVFASGSSIIELIVTGTVSQTPFWSTDGGVTVASSATYTFTDFVPANGVIDTSSQPISLVNPISTSSNVLLTVPSNCTIGGPKGYAVTNTSFVVNGTDYANGAQIDVTHFPAGGSSGATNVRFSGIPQNVQGALSCPANGNLTYTY